MPIFKFQNENIGECIFSPSLMGHVVIGTSVCLRCCFLLTLTGLVIIWTSGMCVSASRAFGTNRNHVGLYWKCSAGRGWRRRGEWEGGCQCVRTLSERREYQNGKDCVRRNVDYPLENNSSIFNMGSKSGKKGVS